MALTVLVSVSLLALVVNARPVLPRDVTQSSEELQSTVQAIFQSRIGEDIQGAQVHLTSPQAQIAYLASLESLDAVKAVLPLGQDSPEEEHLHSILQNHVQGSLNDLDGDVLPVGITDLAEELSTDLQAASEGDVVSEADADVASSVPHHALPSPPLIILAFSAIVSLLAVLCIAAALYAIRCLRTGLLRSTTAWEILPRLEKGAHGAATHAEESILVKEKMLLTSGAGVNAEPTDQDGQLRDDFDTPVAVTTDVRIQDEDKAAPPLIDLSDDVEVIEPQQGAVDAEADPALLPLPALALPIELVAPIPALRHSTSLRDLTSSSPPPPPALRHSASMRELTSSPVSKPAWSLRAADSPSLGLAVASPSSSPSGRSMSPVSSPKIPGALLDLDAQPVYPTELETPARRRAYRAPVPELDIAFALQLRPGLGIGADPAWLVRFLMAMFGWMTILVGGGSGGARRTAQRA